MSHLTLHTVYIGKGSVRSTSFSGYTSNSHGMGSRYSYIVSQHSLDNTWISIPTIHSNKKRSICCLHHHAKLINDNLENIPTEDDHH